MCGIKITNTNPSLEIIACYRTPGSTLAQMQWDMIVNNIDNSNQSILVGDFNAHSQAWNCINTDTNGNRFTDSINSHDLFVHNYNTNTYVNINSAMKSNLDLIISTMKISHKLNVSVLDKTYGSDHFPILVDVQIQKNIYVRKTFKLKTIRTNWKHFNMELDETYHKFLENNYINLTPSSKYDFFMNNITNALININPKPRINGKKKCQKPSSMVE